MKKSFIIKLLLLLSISFSLYSCHIEDEIVQNVKEPKNKFAAFTPKNTAQQVNYSKSFEYLYNRYYEIRKIPIKEKNNKENISYIDFLYHSQLIEFSNGDKAMLFPIINNNDVTSLLVGLLEQGETYLKYYYLSQSYENYNFTISNFQKVINDYKAINHKTIDGGDGGYHDIPEVIIPHPGGMGWTGFPPQNGNGTCIGCPPTDEIPSGPCGKYFGCNSNGNGGLDNNPPENPNQDIISELQGYPCAQNIVQQLPDLKNDIAEAMKTIFNNNDKYNITFKPKSGLGNVDGTTHTSYSSEFGTFNAIISINSDVLQNATKEYILVTMYHEVVHAFLDFERNKLGLAAFQDQYPSVIVGYDYAANGIMINRYTFVSGHQQVGAFLGTLQNILSSYNSNLPNETAKAMAKAGITTMTAEESALNKNEKDVTLGNYKGTKCP